MSFFSSLKRSVLENTTAGYFLVITPKETAVEDEEISKLMQLGRGNLLNASSTRPQFDHPTEETANTHWFEWMKQQEKLYKDTSY